MKYIKIEEYQQLQFQDKQEVINTLNSGGIIVFPSDSVYSLGCLLGNQKGIDRILKITGKVEKKSNLSLFFTDLKSLSDYTLNYNNTIFRSVKNLTPGPFTFIFRASKIVTKMFENSKKEVGIRIPDHPILSDILKELDQPIISTSLNTGELKSSSNDPYEISEQYKDSVDLVIDYGAAEGGVTTVLDCTGDDIELIRQGKGQLID
ncbi:L-threonylcarbamoyladenylate synthase [Saprospiraceae bacterium]|nr:L-threonylcarbamoyladenylate synthase [Saprospiraceae bacterium]